MNLSLCPGCCAQQAVTVSVNAKAVTASATGIEPGWAIASPIAFACLLLPFVRRKRLKTLLGIAALLMLGLLGVGCGGSSGTPTSPTTPTTPQSATHVVTVNASAGTGTTAKVIPLVVTITN